MSSMNVNQISAWQNVDLNAIGSVTEKLLERANTKTVDLNKIDLSKFNRQTQGVDLYSPKVSIDYQRQIAMTNAGLINNANVDVSKINAFAAQNLYGTNTAKQVEGKMTIAISEGEKEQAREVYQLPVAVEVFSTASMTKDKRGSNPFATYSSVKNEDNEDGLDILG